MKNSNVITNIEGIKIGDFVKLKEWSNFLEVIGESHHLGVICIGEGESTAWYPISLGFIKRGDKMEEDTNTKQGEFQVGDKVWCTVYGPGEVTNIRNCMFPILVKFSTFTGAYTKDGRCNTGDNRTLFFSEPKIEAAVTRPFVSTLVGKRVVMQYIDGVWFGPKIISKEDNYAIYSEGGSVSTKSGLLQIVEISSENLLKK